MDTYRNPVIFAFHGVVSSVEPNSREEENEYVNAQVAQLWQRDRATSHDFKGCVTLTINFRLSVTFRANIHGPLDGGILYYNFAAGSSHSKKLCSRLYSIEIEFY